MPATTAEALPEQSGLAPLTPDDLLALYRDIVLIRRMEELAAKAYAQRLIRGFCHLYIGQEAVAVGASAACRPDDPWIAAYREHGHALARGVPPRAVMAELFGRATGCSRGMGGSVHLFDAQRNFLGGYGIVGGQVPLANGVAWALRHQGRDGVCLCFFGEGAANQGVFFEALCLAQLYRLPVVFVCENNGYAMGTAVSRQSAVTEMAVRAHGVGMASHRFEGFDVREVREQVGRAVAFARSGRGPVLLEVVTYRFRGHSMSDPAKYRPRSEVEAQKQRDPRKLARAACLEAGISEERLAEVEAEVEATCQDAWDFAANSPEPDPADLYAYVYAE